MSQVKPTDSFENDQAILLLSLGAAVFFIWLWFSKFVLIACTALYWLWRLADFSAIHAYAAERINLLADTANNADSVTAKQFLDVLNHTSEILFIFLIPMCIACVIGLIGHPSLGLRSKRMINIYSLPRVMSRFAPAIAPVLADSKTQDLLMNDEREEHRWAMHPEEFAEKYDLINAKQLDREKAKEAFLAQLGERFTDEKSLKDYEKALFTVFGLQVFFNDRRKAKQLLDSLNRSCLSHKGSNKNTLLRPNFSITDKEFQNVWQAPQVKELFTTHAYVRTALSSLLANDIHLPGSQYRWLKGIDRTLWYALHSTDTQSVFVEGAGVLAQARFEKKVSEHNLNLKVDYVETAIDGLQQDLETIGLVHEKRTPEKKSKSKDIDWQAPELSTGPFIDDDQAALYSPLLESDTYDQESHSPQLESSHKKTDDYVPSRNSPLSQSTDIQSPVTTQNAILIEQDDDDSYLEQYASSYQQEKPVNTFTRTPSKKLDVSRETPFDDVSDL